MKTTWRVSLPWALLAVAVVGGGVRAADDAPPATAGRARIEITPAQVLEGDPVSIRVTGLSPGALATVQAQSLVRDDAGKSQPYYSEATFQADARGDVDLATDAPVKGDYRGADLRGLFWSARPLTGEHEAQAAVAALKHDSAASLKPNQVRLTLEVAGAVQDRETLTFVHAAPDTVRETVHSGGLIGVFYYRKGAKHCPVVVVLGGSEGGLDVADWAGPRLAARGYVVFGIDYFNPPGEAVAGVPTALEHIPVELLERARDWLKARSEVDIGRLGLLAYSKGSEFALVLASRYDWIDAAVVYAPSDYIWQGIDYTGGPAASSWSQAGRDLPYLPTTGIREAIQKARAAGGRVALAPVLKAHIAAADPQTLEAARIKIEDSHAALLLIGGGDDELGDSGASVGRIAAELKHAGYPHTYETAIYPGAGHDLVGTGWRPTTADDTDFFRDGGTPVADAHAQADSWMKMLDFLREALRPQAGASHRPPD